MIIELLDKLLESEFEDTFKPVSNEEAHARFDAMKDEILKYLAGAVDFQIFDVFFYVYGSKAENHLSTLGANTEEKRIKMMADWARSWVKDQKYNSYMLSDLYQDLKYRDEI